MNYTVFFYFLLSLLLLPFHSLFQNLFFPLLQTLRIIWSHMVYSHGRMHFFFENKNVSNLFLFQLYNQKKSNLCKHLYKYLHCSFFIAIFSYFENSISFWFCLNKLSAYLPIIFIFQDYFSIKINKIVIFSMCV